MGRCRFEGHEIDLATGELKRDGQPVALQRQPARVLAHLVAHAGTLVPREDLHAAIWSADVHVDFDRGLNYCIRQLRETLRDDVRAPRFIATIPRQGYRFVADVAPVLPNVAPLLDELPRPAHEAGAVKGRRLALGSTGTSRWAVAAALAAAGVAALAIDIASGTSPDHHRIAVAMVRSIHDAIF